MVCITSVISRWKNVYGMGIPEKSSSPYPSQKKWSVFNTISEEKICPIVIRTDQGLAVAKPPQSCNRSE